MKQKKICGERNIMINVKTTTVIYFTERHHFSQTNTGHSIIKDTPGEKIIHGNLTIVKFHTKPPVTIQGVPEEVLEDFSPTITSISSILKQIEEEASA